MTTNLTTRSKNTSISRRQVMIGAAGLSFAFVLGGPLARAATLATEPTGKALSPWVSIAPDGTITIMSAATEMGQGSMTSLPLILAEDLDADWSKVQVVAAPPIDAIYGNPGFGGMRYTAGSNAVRSYYLSLRTFGAQVRDKPPEIKPEQLKKPSQFRLIGKDVMRVDVPGKVNGTARYAIDVQVPGMLYGAVLRAPVEGATPDKIDESKAEAVTGVIKVIRMPYGVGVVAETPWAAFAAREALTHSTTWTKAGKAWGFDSEKGLEDFARAARDPKAEAAEWSKSGDPRHALSTAATTFEAEYRCDYAYHAQMEPLNAVAVVSPTGDSAEIWCGTQSQTTAQEASAKALGIAREKVKLNYLLMGGGFGRRGPRDADFVVDAVLLAKDAGRPVKVMWTREDDVHNGRFRPLSAHYLRAGFDPSGKLAVYHHRLVGDRVTPFFDPVRYESRGRKDFILMIGADFGSYEVPHQLVEQLYRDTGVRTAPLRGISWTANKFAVETFIDEIAVKRGT